MKLPAIQFYPADWRKDPGVQSLDYFDRGVWFEILCLMHESPERGKLILNGDAMPDEALARILGLDNQTLTKTLTTLLKYGVASRDQDSGALMNRRMVKDETLRQIRTEAGKKGGNPALLNQKPTTRDKQKPTTPVKQIPTPSSSSSFTSSESATPSGLARNGRDPNLDNEAVKVYREVCHLTPNHQQRATIVSTVVNTVLYADVLRQYMVEGQPPQHVDWTLERYVKAKGQSKEAKEQRQAEIARRAGREYRPSAT